MSIVTSLIFQAFDIAAMLICMYLLTIILVQKIRYAAIDLHWRLLAFAVMLVVLHLAARLYQCFM